MQYENNYNQPPRFNAGGYTNSYALADRVSQALKLVYIKMAIGLLVTGLLAYVLSNTSMTTVPGRVEPVSAYNLYVMTHSWVMWVFMLGSFGIVFAIGGAHNRMSTAAGTALFYLMAVLYGLWLAPIFVIYTGTSIAKTFFITAGTFGAMSIYGYTTKADLSRFGSILFMALIGLIIASVVNIFTHSQTFGWIISIFGVLIFVGLTAWDTQQIKQMAMVIPANETGRLATMGALSLYLDFINLFLYLLRFFGSSRD